MRLHLALPVAAHQLLHELQSRHHRSRERSGCTRRAFQMLELVFTLHSCCVSCSTEFTGCDTLTAPQNTLKYTL